jgi:hypothetical protein
MYEYYSMMDDGWQCPASLEESFECFDTIHSDSGFHAWEDVKDVVCRGRGNGEE